MIKKSIQVLIGESYNKMLGYVSMQSFYHAQLCIKAEPGSLLPLEIEYLGRTYKFEETARVMLGEGEENKDKMYIYPDDREYLRPLVLAIQKVHPEFKIDVLTNDNDKDNADDKATVNESEPAFGSTDVTEEDEESTNDTEDEKYFYLLLTMPPVNKQQRKIYLDAVDVVNKYIKAKIDTEKGKLTAKVALKTATSTKEETDEVKAALDETYNKNIELADQQTDEKKQEIEDAYQRYLEKHPEENGEENADDNNDGQPAMPEDQSAQDDAEGQQPPQMPKAPDAPANPLEAFGFGS